LRICNHPSHWRTVLPLRTKTGKPSTPRATPGRLGRRRRRRQGLIRGLRIAGHGRVFSGEKRHPQPNLFLIVFNDSLKQCRSCDQQKSRWRIISSARGAFVFNVQLVRTLRRRTVCANQLQDQPNCVVKCFAAINLRACRAPNWWRRAQNAGPQRAFSNYGPPRLRQNCKIWPVRNPVFVAHLIICSSLSHC